MSDTIEALKAKLEKERDRQSEKYFATFGQGAYCSGHKAACDKLLPMIEKAVAVIEFYSNKNNWTINEDYDGYINEGWITEEDIEYQPKIPNTFSGYGYGGKKAREFLAELKKENKK